MGVITLEIKFGLLFVGVGLLSFHSFAPIKIVFSYACEGEVIGNGVKMFRVQVHDGIIVFIMWSTVPFNVNNMFGL